MNTTANIIMLLNTVLYVMYVIFNLKYILSLICRDIFLGCLEAEHFFRQFGGRTLSKRKPVCSVIIFQFHMTQVSKAFENPYDICFPDCSTLLDALCYRLCRLAYKT